MYAYVYILMYIYTYYGSCCCLHHDGPTQLPRSPARLCQIPAFSSGAAHGLHRIFIHQCGLEPQSMAGSRKSGRMSRRSWNATWGSQMFSMWFRRSRPHLKLVLLRSAHGLYLRPPPLLDLGSMRRALREMGVLGIWDSMTDGCMSIEIKIPP